MHFFALGAFVTMAWHDGGGSVVAMDALPALHLALLMATGAAAALLTLRPRQRTAAAEDCRAAAGATQLLAQMSHELRTPLNAVIGFSEVMQRELHGPLGHARYQEYAAYISESGGRLLRASEDALAVAGTMSALAADRRAVRHERVAVADLLHEAWTAAAAGAGRREIRFVVDGNCEIECDRRATGQALEHLLREVIARAPADGAVEARGRRRGDTSSIDINVRPLTQGGPSAVACSADRVCERDAGLVSGVGLHVILARSLLEMQGTTLDLLPDPAALWSASVAFPATRPG